MASRWSPEAAAGIGLRLATALADDGCVGGRSSVATASGPSRAAESLAGDAAGFGGDVTDPTDVAGLVETVTERLRARSNCWSTTPASATSAPRRGQADPDDWWRTIEVNVRGVMLMTSARSLPGMVERGVGRIVDLGSGIGQRAEPRYSAYSVSKAAALRWLDNVAVGLGPAVARARGQRESWSGAHGHDRHDVGPVR